MQKVKITRNCSIGGKHYNVGDVAEVIENDAHSLKGMGRAVDYVGNYAQPEKKKGKK